MPAVTQAGQAVRELMKASLNSVGTGCDIITLHHMPLSNQTRSIYEYALHALEAERTRLDVMIADVRHQLGTGKEPKAAPVATEPGPVTKAKGKKRVMSAEARKRIAAAQKK